jgi:site-specific DNA recombinase
MASHRAVTTGASATTAAQGVASHAPTRHATQASGGSSLKRAALYARVSTDTQEREDTVARQVDLLYQTASAYHDEVLPGAVCIAAGSSGTRLERPALERLRDLVAEGVFAGLLVTAPDRLARREAYQVVVVEECIRGGCEVIWVPPSPGPSPAEQMRLQRQGVFAEYERALIHERTRRGRLFAARQGRVNWGTPPSGYTYVRKTVTMPQPLVVHETEAEVVRQISRWCVEEPMRSSAIHQRLTVQGIPPRQSSPRGWAHRSVMEILRASRSKGEADANRTPPGDVRRPSGPRGLKARRPGHGQGRTRRPQADGIPVQVPALIAPATWARAQAQRVRHRERAQRHTTHHRSLVRSLLVCGRCGRRLVGPWSAQGGRYLCALRDPRDCAGGVRGPPPQCDDARAMGLGSREGVVVRPRRLAEAV